MDAVNAVSNIQTKAAQILSELLDRAEFGAGKLIVVGCSTSEIAGKHIGTGGTLEIAEAIFRGLDEVRRRYNVDIAYQCCEHLNRALVVEQHVAQRWMLEEVSAVPVQKAGGSMATYAYRHMNNPCLVETIAAHAGIDIGDTLIGMHLRRVAVPFRPSVQSIGMAHVTAAFTRPKLIGGERACYTRNYE